VVAVEALLRWEHPDRGRLAPAEFLEVARRAGRIPRITRYVLDRAIGDLQPLWGSGSSIGLHVNISADDLVDERVLALARAGARVIRVGKRGGCRSTRRRSCTARPTRPRPLTAVTCAAPA
jgi:EAL domain-containing protein (putative c-di-GMP-specific phosphodiesterase class I)